MYFVVKIYEASGKPASCIILLLALFRDRDLAILFLQNDNAMAFCIVMCIYFAINSRIYTSAVFFTLALSIKGGAMLWLPGYLLVIDFCVGLLGVLASVLLILAYQVISAIPFLRTNKAAYFN